jgi:hypothetical protein
MNGCSYCVILHNRKRHGRRRARGVAMCLAQEEMTRCHKKWYERGPGCEYHDIKIHALNHKESPFQPATVVDGQRSSRHTSTATGRKNLPSRQVSSIDGP